MPYGFAQMRIHIQFSYTWNENQGSIETFYLKIWQYLSYTTPRINASLLHCFLHIPNIWRASYFSFEFQSMPVCSEEAPQRSLKSIHRNVFNTWALLHLNDQQSLGGANSKFINQTCFKSRAQQPSLSIKNLDYSFVRTNATYSFF